MDQPRYQLGEAQRKIVLETIIDQARYRGWTLLAVHVRSTHVHVVLQAELPPERVMNILKSYASRALNQLGLDGTDRKRWTRHGSTRYLWRDEEVIHAIEYVVRQQGDPLEVLEAKRYVPSDVAPSRSRLRPPHSEPRAQSRDREGAAAIQRDRTATQRRDVAAEGGGPKRSPRPRFSSRRATPPLSPASSCSLTGRRKETKGRGLDCFSLVSPGPPRTVRPESLNGASPDNPSIPSPIQ